MLVLFSRFSFLPSPGVYAWERWRTNSRSFFIFASHEGGENEKGTYREGLLSPGVNAWARKRRGTNPRCNVPAIQAMFLAVHCVPPDNLLATIALFCTLKPRGSSRVFSKILRAAEAEVLSEHRWPRSAVAAQNPCDTLSNSKLRVHLS
jgi:hypothetical protein